MGLQFGSGTAIRLSEKPVCVEAQEVSDRLHPASKSPDQERLIAGVAQSQLSLMDSNIKNRLSSKQV